MALAAAARLGARHRLSLAELRRPIGFLIAACAAAAFLAGLVGASLAAGGLVALPPPWEDLIAPDRHVRFAAVSSAHIASYALGGLGGLLVVARTIRGRRRPGIPSPPSGR